MTYHLGVDLGTTYSAAAVVREGRPEIVGLGTRASEIPSVVFLKEDETILIGEAASRRGLANPPRVAREFKRRFGDPTPIMLAGTPIAADALWARMLGWILTTVTASEGGSPDSVAVTHPANWGPYKLDLLAQAIRLAGVHHPLTLSEPEAAAIFYATSNRVEPGEVVAVYDLGGGTFDTAILRRTQSGFELLGRPEGIERLGGIDVDEAVFSHVVETLGATIEDLDPADAAVRSAVARLRQECTSAKEALSQDTDASIPVILPGVSTEVRLTRSELESMIRPTLAPTVDALRRAVTSARLEPEDLKAVLLVGGTSRIPLVGQLVAQGLGRPVVTDAHPKHSVALGAALHAATQAPSASDASSIISPAEVIEVPTVAAPAPAAVPLQPAPASPPAAEPPSPEPPPSKPARVPKTRVPKTRPPAPPPPGPPPTEPPPTEPPPPEPPPPGPPHPEPRAPEPPQPETSAEPPPIQQPEKSKPKAGLAVAAAAIAVIGGLIFFFFFRGDDTPGPTASIQAQDLLLDAADLGEGWSIIDSPGFEVSCEVLNSTFAGKSSQRLASRLFEKPDEAFLNQFVRVEPTEDAARTTVERTAAALRGSCQQFVIGPVDYTVGEKPFSSIGDERFLFEAVGTEGETPQGFFNYLIVREGATVTFVYYLPIDQQSPQTFLEGVATKIVDAANGNEDAPEPTGTTSPDSGDLAFIAPTVLNPTRIVAPREFSIFKLYVTTVETPTVFVAGYRSVGVDPLTLLIDARISDSPESLVSENLERVKGPDPVTEELDGQLRCVQQLSESSGADVKVDCGWVQGNVAFLATGLDVHSKHIVIEFAVEFSNALERS